MTLETCHRTCLLPRTKTANNEYLQATIVLNGQEICKTRNMFIPERIDVTLEEENVLEITFDSTYLAGKKIVEKFPDHHWGCWNGDPSRLAVRKAQFHYVSTLCSPINWCSSPTNS